MLVIEVEVQSRIGNDESSVALLVFVVTKNWGIGVNLPNSTIKYLPTNLWPYDFSCQDGYDDVFGVLWSTEPCKDGKLKSSENK